MQQLLNKIKPQVSEQVTDPESFLRERLALYVGSPGSMDNPNLQINPGTRDIENMADNRYFSDLTNGIDSGEAYRKRKNFIEDYNNALQLYRDASAEGPTGFAAPIQYNQMTPIQQGMQYNVASFDNPNLANSGMTPADIDKLRVMQGQDPMSFGMRERLINAMRNRGYQY